MKSFLNAVGLTKSETIVDIIASMNSIDTPETATSIIMKKIVEDEAARQEHISNLTAQTDSEPFDFDNPVPPIEFGLMPGTLRWLNTNIPPSNKAKALEAIKSTGLNDLNTFTPRKGLSGFIYRLQDEINAAKYAQTASKLQVQ